MMATTDNSWVGFSEEIVTGCKFSSDVTLSCFLIQSMLHHGMYAERGKELQKNHTKHRYFDELLTAFAETKQTERNTKTERL